MADFVSKRFEPEEPPHNQCWQIVLSLNADDQTCTLTQSFFYNDWGDRMARDTVHEGTYRQDGKSLVCTMTRGHKHEVISDHEMGYNSDETTDLEIKEPVAFVFKIEEGFTLPPPAIDSRIGRPHPIGRCRGVPALRN